MKNTFKILLVILSILFPASIYAKEVYIGDQIDTKIADKVQAKYNSLLQQLQKETDPVKRSKLIYDLDEVQKLFFNTKVRESVLKKQYPEYGMVEVEKSQPGKKAPDKPITIFNATKDWDSFSVEQKTKFCGQLKEGCEKKNNLEYCRFLISKCKDYMEESDYNETVKKFSTKKK